MARIDGLVEAQFVRVVAVTSVLRGRWYGTQVRDQPLSRWRRLRRVSRHTAAVIAAHLRAQAGPTRSLSFLHRDPAFADELREVEESRPW